MNVHVSNTRHIHLTVSQNTFEVCSSVPFYRLVLLNAHSTQEEEKNISCTSFFVCLRKFIALQIFGVHIIQVCLLQIFD